MYGQVLLETGGILFYRTRKSAGRQAAGREQTSDVRQCDLHMPNKDGYQTCREIREYEKRNSYPHVPIVALSANVLGDVWAKCVESGFNNYVTKPVDFKELGNVMLKFMDPSDPKRPIEFMKAKKKHAA